MNEATESKKSAITVALIAAQKAFKPAKKNAENPFFHSRYADLEECWDAVRDALHANGLTVIQPVRWPAGAPHPGVETELRHVSGESITSFYPLIPAKVSDPQAFAQAVTYARRYSLMAIVVLCPEDDDGETATGRGAGSAKPGAARPPAPPRQKAAETPNDQDQEFVVSGTIEDCGRTNGTNSKGKPWVKLGVKLGGKWYNTFDLNLMDDIEKAFTGGVPVDLTWKQDGQYRNIVNCVVQGGIPF